MATKYRITVLDKDPNYGGNFYTGFALIEEGSMRGAYFGVIDGADVIFYADELKSVTPTYSITVLDLPALNEEMGEDFSAASEAYAGKTYPGFILIEEGMYSGAYQGVIQLNDEDEEVIFYETELQTITKEI